MVDEIWSRYKAFNELFIGFVKAFIFRVLF